LDGFNPNHVCNHSDTSARYAYNKQPNVAYWNLFCLGQALLPLIENQELALAALEPYRSRFPAQLQRRLCAKLGLAAAENRAWIESAASKTVLDGLMKLMAAEQTDWTIFFSRWTHALGALAEERNGQAAVQSLRDLFIDRDGFDAWLLHFSQQQTMEIPWEACKIIQKLAKTGLLDASERTVATAMHQTASQTNPRVVLRTHLAQEAIDAAQSGDFAPTSKLLAALETPFATHHDSKFSAFPPDWAKTLQVSCSS
jgi:serine/tyrosine/threonine adenylyltransferase